MAITAQADPAPGVNAAALFDRIQVDVEGIVLPDGYALEWRGQRGSSQDANAGIAATMPMGFGAMIVIVVLLFNERVKVAVITRNAEGVSFVNILFVTVTVLAACHPAISDAKGKHDYIGNEIAEIPIFDAHMHYNDRAWASVPPKTVLKLMDDSGVAMALVSSTPDEGTLTLVNFAPKRIVPELRPYHGEVDSTNWTRLPDMFEYLSTRLATQSYSGIGEFHLHKVSIEDKTLLRQIAAIAIERDLLIHIHSGKAPVDLLYDMQPELRIIWAHAGMVEPAKVVEAMMARYDALYADTSYRESDIMNDDGIIDADWRRVIERFPARFMIGSDTWTNSQWAEYRDLIKINRKWLSQFSRSIAENVAYKNAERLFGRKVSNHLLGTR